MIRIIHDDNHLLVVEKPPGTLSQSDRTGDPDLLTLLKADLKRRHGKPGNAFLGLVHRLDRPVGGVMLFAKTSKAASRLSQQLRAGTMHKHYRAVVHGVPIPAEDTLRHYLVKDRQRNIVTAVAEPVEGAKEARLDYQVLGNAPGLSLVAIRLHTGRALQIRVQFAARSHPLYGDTKYGGPAVEQPTGSIALWAVELQCTHPTTRGRLTFESPPPDSLPWSLFGGWQADPFTHR